MGGGTADIDPEMSPAYEGETTGGAHATFPFPMGMEQVVNSACVGLAAVVRARIYTLSDSGSRVYVVRVVSEVDVSRMSALRVARGLEKVVSACVGLISSRRRRERRRRRSVWLLWRI